MLATYSTPESILSADREELLQILLNNRRGLSWNEKKLDVLLTTARESLPDLQGQCAHQTSLLHYIKLLNCYHECISDVESHLTHLAEQLPVYALLRTIPGVGPITAAVILSEVGDIKRFPTTKQLTAFAGLDSSVYESGTFKSNKNRISKRGSSYLRTALYQATVCGISKQVHGPRNPILSRYYQQKRADGKSAKVAIVATSNKLLRIIFGMWTREEPFKVI